MPNAYTRSCQLLEESRVVEALVTQSNWLSRLKDGLITDECNNIKNDYALMAGYFFSGADDTQRSEVIKQLVLRSYAVVDKIYERMRVLTNSRQEFIKLRQIESRKITLEPLQETQTLDSIFESVWLNTALTQVDYDSLLALVFDTQRTNEALVAVAALWLNTLRRFSESQILCLAEIAKLDNKVGARAMVAWVFTILYYNSRLRFYPAITENIKAMMADEPTQKRIMRVLNALLLTERVGEAQKIMQDMQGEVMKELDKRNKQGNEGVTKDALQIISDAEDEIPEWFEKMQDRMSESVDSISALAHDGVDVNYANLSFARTDKFFSEKMLNWFVPFYTENPDIGVDITKIKEKNILDIIQSGETCDSDKYAICVLFRYLTQNATVDDEKMQLLTEQFSDLEETAWRMEANDKRAIENFVRDIYRFFKLNQWSYPDLLPEILDAIPNSLFVVLCDKGSNEYLLKFADTFARISKTDEAVRIYEKVLEDEVSAEVYRKLGYVQEQAQRYERALAAYERADIIVPNDKWTLWHQVKLLMLLSRYDEALMRVETLISLYGQRKHYLKAKAELCRQQHIYAAALKLYYQLLFENGDDIEARRGVIRMALLEGQLDTALTNSVQLFHDERAELSDKMTYGHLLALARRYAEAVEVYVRMGVEKAELIKAFIAERERVLGMITESDSNPIKNLESFEWVMIEQMVTKEI